MTPGIWSHPPPEVLRKMETACGVREETLKLDRDNDTSLGIFRVGAAVAETSGRLSLLTKANAARMARCGRTRGKSRICFVICKPRYILLDCVVWAPRYIYEISPREILAANDLQ